MKPTSVISMIVAVLLIIAGFVTCLVAQNMAEAEGQQLFAESRDYGLVNTIDLSDTLISKLEIHVEDAQVNIYGNSPSSYIELVNFRENYYSFSSANRVVSFDELPDVTSMLKFWENGVSFKGMRYLLDRSEEPEGEKVINIYLGGENTDLKILNVTGTKCRLYLENMTTGTDYGIQIGEGTLTCSQLKTSSVVTLSGETLECSFENCNIATMNAECTDLTIRAESFYTLMVDIKGGNVDLEVSPQQMISLLNYNISLDSGSVTVNGNDLGGSFVQNVSSNNSFKVKAESGSVVLTDPVPQTTPAATGIGQ